MDPTALLVPLLLAHPAALHVALIALAVGSVAAFAWKLVPTATRDAFEQRHPRWAGAIRIVVALWPSLVDAGKAAQRQVIAGEPKATLSTITVHVGGDVSDTERMRSLVSAAISDANKSRTLPDDVRRGGAER